MSSMETLARLQFADDMFARRHRTGLSPVSTQLVWSLPALPERAAVEQVMTRLEEGSLARTVVRRRMPLARDAWAPLQRPGATASEILAAAGRQAPLPEAGRLDWLRHRCSVPLDPYAGRPYDLAVARTHGGGALASLVTSHAVADGAAVLASFAGPARPVPPVPSGPRLLTQDLADAWGQAREISRWVGARAERARRSAQARGTGPAAPRAVSHSTATASHRRPALAVLELDSAELSTAARERGGSRGTLLSVLLARVTVAVGRVPQGAPVRVAVPVSERAADDLRANSTRIAMVEIPADELASGDLGTVRARSAAAYEALGEVTRELDAVPLAAVQALPDAVVRRLPQPPAAAALASNIGRIGEEVTGAFGIEASAMTALALHAQDATAELRASGGGVLGWLADAGGRSTLSVVVADPERTPDDAGLAALLRREVSSWGLQARAW